MESSESSRELLDNVTITDGSQYMIQRMGVENSQLLSTELLNHHNGLVVDLGAGDFIPVNYSSEDLLGQDLTDEDRNLAAALVAVQLSQQQKQQQLQQDSGVMISTSLPSLVSSNGLDAGKVNLSDQQLLLNAEKSNLNGSYLQIVGSDSLYVDKQSLPKLMGARFDDPDVYERSKPDLKLIKDDDSHDNSSLHRDSDGETKCDTRSSKKSLPHKKRISRKLKKNVSASRKSNRCNLCEQTFGTPEEFAQHQALCETTITPVHASNFSCQLCSATFGDQLSFFGHLKAHYEPLNEAGSSGGAAVGKVQEKQEPPEAQRDSLLNSLLNNIHCVQCNKTFRRQKTYEAHVREIHSKMELNEFSEPEDLMAGIDVVVDQGGQDSDDDTKAWYQRDDELQATEVDLKEFEAQEHVCHICKQPFPIRAILLQHLVTCRSTAENGDKVETAAVTKKKTRKQKEELSCTECDRVFTHRNSLIYHMRSHTGTRPHQCDQCGKSFFAASALKVHLRLHSGDKPYGCDVCGRNFRQWGDLKYHCISKHSDEKEYQCEYCGKDFARKYSLIVHRRIHTGEKNYKCEFCQKTFRASSYLQNHRRIHTGEKPHSCDVCGKPFRVRSDMKRHLKTHGRKKIGSSKSSTQAASNFAASTPDLVITKVEDVENSGGMSDNSADDHKEEAEAAVSSLQYDHDPLDTSRNALYANGPQLFICYPGEIPVRTVESASTWMQTD